MLSREQSLGPAQEFQSQWEQVAGILSPYADALKNSGQQVEPHLNNALRLYAYYLQNPTEAVKYAIQAHGLTGEQLGIGDAPIEDDYTDPSIKALQAQLQETQRELQAVRSQTNQASQQSASEVYSRFKEATDADGNLLHPFAEQVETQMAMLIGQGSTLEEAYEQAKWSSTDYRDSVIQDKVKAATTVDAATQRAQAQAKVTAARKAADVIPAGDADVSKSDGPGAFTNWGDALAETMTKLRS